MNILVIGSGGREHALCWKLKQSSKVEKIYCVPGNAGIAQVAECVPGNIHDFSFLVSLAKEKQIGFTVVGPEAPLVDGVVDAFEKEGLKVFGPNKKAAQLEGSKIFSKEIMQQAGVPTADYKIFDDLDEAKTHVINADYPLVIKADGLCAGKGVFIISSAEEAIKTLDDIFVKRIFGDSGNKVLIENCITGPEISILGLTDGERVISLASSQDHKRAFDGDKGPNTGGMGAYSPFPLVLEKDLLGLVEQTMTPIIQALKKQGIVYKGLLYGGLMLTEQGPQVLEFNVRFGDPEVQAVMMRLKNDLLDLLIASSEGDLSQVKMDWDQRASMSVVLASGGYPGSYEKGKKIEGFEEAEKDGAVVFHAGTTLNDSGEVVTSGGRVLAVTALGETLLDARDNAYKAVSDISFEGMHFRNDIGHQILKTVQ